MATPEPDYTIWSRLPHILLPIIIENTADFPTLEAWCQSTSQSSYLHRIANREVYRSYAFNLQTLRRTAPFNPRCIVREDSDDDDDDVPSDPDEILYEVCEPRDCVHASEPSDCAHASASVLSDKSRQEIARHVQRLVLDHECLDQPKPALPMPEDLDFIWQSFLSYATRLEEIEHSGILWQVMLDRLLATPSLKMLKIREIWTRHLIRWDDLVLNWQNLGQCSSLTVLHIAQLSHPEAVGLAIAIRGLHNLEDLRVKVSELRFPGANRQTQSDDPSPLKPFLRSLYQQTGLGFDRTPIGFPASLKKLALVDFNSRLTPTSLHGLSVASLKHLTHLHLDLLYDSATIYLLDNLNPLKLTHLTISSMLYVEPHSAWLRVQEIFARHSSTLRQITLFNAWLGFQPYTPDTYPPWISFMEFSQLYLAEHPKSSFFTHDENLHWRIFGNINRASKWGLGVQQIRIDQVDINELKVNRIDESCNGLKQLRILVLRARSKSAKLCMGRSELGSLPLPLHEPFGPYLPDDMDTLKETEIAKAIAAQELPSLRIISVGRYRFWVQHRTAKIDSQSTRGSSPSKVVWFLRRALEDPLQEAEIMRVVHPDDWNFLADRSNCLAEGACDESIRLANRLVYRNIQTEEAN